MSFDQNTLNELLRRSDEELWQMVLTIAALRGISLPKVPPPHEDFEKLRKALGGVDGTNVSEALEIIEKYRRTQS